MSVTPLRRPESAKAAPQHPWARPLGRILSGVLILAAVLLGRYIYRLYYTNPRTDDAYVHANTAALAAHVSGAALLVHGGGERPAFLAAAQRPV